MKHTPIIAAMALAASSAHATLQLCVGPTCGVQGPGIENILLPDVGDTGFTITGETNITHTLVDFTSSEEMVVTGGGQAKLTATDGVLGDVRFFAQDPQTGFLDAIFNVHAGADTTINISARDNFGTLFDFGAQLADGSGQNFFHIGSLDDQFIKTVYINGDDIYAVDELQQVRVSPASLPGGPPPPPPPPAVVPIPSAAFFFGPALIGLATLGRKRRQETAEARPALA